MNAKFITNSLILRKTRTRINLILIVFIILSTTHLKGQRVVLLEQFTNSGCSICASHDPATYAYVAGHNTQLVAISYHTAFPYFDSMYLENSAESNARTSFYTIVSVPYSILDGNYYRNSTPTFNTIIGSTVTSRGTTLPQYQITALQNEFDGNLLSSTFAFQSLNATNANDSLRAYIVVIEENVLKNSYAASPGNNTQTVYNYVMRKMLPNANGSYLINRNLNATETISLNWNMQHIKNKSELRVIAFVQNLSTKEIYNASMVTPLNVTGVAELNKYESAKIYPNPTNGLLYIAFTKTIRAEIELSDIRGKVVYKTSINNESNFVLDVEKFSKGIYVLGIKSNEFNQTKKIAIE